MSLATLSDSDFAAVVANAPLVSIDLLVERDGRFLFGLRTNRPAQGFLFVPGGRIRKGESIHNAIERISSGELGIQVSMDRVRPLAVTQHFYCDSRPNTSIPTHYVVLPYHVLLAPSESVKSDSQHSEFMWLSLDEIQKDVRIHLNAKAHFVAFESTSRASSDPKHLLSYYHELVEQMKSYNQIVWAFPAVYLYGLWAIVSALEKTLLGGCPGLIGAGIIAVAFLYAFYRHLDNHNAIKDACLEAENRLKLILGAGVVPKFNKNWVKATYIMLVVLLLASAFVARHWWVLLHASHTT